MRLTRRDRNGLLFIHATTVCKLQLRVKKMAVTDRYQPQAGGLGDMRRSSSIKMSLGRSPFLRMLATVTPATVSGLAGAGRHTGHDYQRAHHVALGPRFQRHRPWRGWLQGARVGGVPDRDTHFETGVPNDRIRLRDRITGRQRSRNERRQRVAPGMVVVRRVYTKRREHTERIGRGY